MIYKEDKNNIDNNETKIKLKINEIDIKINNFVKKYLKNTLFGMISTLNTTDYNIENIENTQINISKIDPEHMYKTKITLQINETPIEINEFVKIKK